MFLNERMRHQPRLAVWRSFGLVAFIPLVLAAVTRAEPIEQNVGEFWGSAYEAGCLILVLLGLTLRGVVSGCHVLARDHLDASGVYSVTRNPSYLANSLILVGIMLYTQDLALAVATALWLAVYYERRILAEEARLFRRFGMAFVGWATLTPIFLPRFTSWRRPAAPFSVRAFLRREPLVWCGAIAALATIATASAHFGKEPIDDLGLLILLAVAAMAMAASLVGRGMGLLDDHRI